MFTGIVQEVGTITDVESIGGGIRFRIYAPGCARDLRTDNSISVNGVCLTVVARKDDEFDVEAVEETLSKTTLGSFEVGDHMNLELPVKLQDRMDGHMVLGHVDAVGIITGIEERSSSRMIGIDLPPEHAKYLIPVGSIALDGVSLTIARVENSSIGVSIIPHTLEHTICKFYGVGDHVNAEFDVIGKFVERLVSGYDSKNFLRKSYTENELKELGY